MYPTLNSTPTGTICFVGVDGQGNLKKLVQPTGSNAPATINLGSKTIFTEYDAATNNNSLIWHNPNGVWLDSDGHNGIYLGYDLSDGRWNSQGAMFFRFSASSSVESGPPYTRYNFETAGDRYYKDFTDDFDGVSTDVLHTYWTMNLFGGVQSSGATISATKFGVQGAPAATLTPGPITIIVSSANSYATTNLNALSTPIISNYMGGVLQSVNFVGGTPTPAQ